mgnify:CR=1 FL=1
MSNFESQLPTGNYEGEVISQELTISTNNHPTFEIKFGNLVHATDGPVNPETRFVGSVDQFVLDSPDAISIIGNKVGLYMKEGQHGGATTEDWDISSGNSSSSTSVDAMTAKELAAKWSHLMVKGVPTPAPTTTTPPERESTF